MIIPHLRSNGNLFDRQFALYSFGLSKLMAPAPTKSNCRVAVDRNWNDPVIQGRNQEKKQTSFNTHCNSKSGSTELVDDSYHWPLPLEPAECLSSWEDKGGWTYYWHCSNHVYPSMNLMLLPTLVHQIGIFMNASEVEEGFRGPEKLQSWTWTKQSFAMLHFQTSMSASICWQIS